MFIVVYWNVQETLEMIWVTKFLNGQKCLFLVAFDKSPDNSTLLALGLCIKIYFIMHSKQLNWFTSLMLLKRKDTACGDCIACIFSLGQGFVVKFVGELFTPVSVWWGMQGWIWPWLRIHNWKQCFLLFLLDLTSGCPLENTSNSVPAPTLQLANWIIVGYVGFTVFVQLY